MTVWMVFSRVFAVVVGFTFFFYWVKMRFWYTLRLLFEVFCQKPVCKYTNIENLYTQVKRHCFVWILWFENWVVSNSDWINFNRNETEVNVVFLRKYCNWISSQFVLCTNDYDTERIKYVSKCQRENWLKSALWSEFFQSNINNSWNHRYLTHWKSNFNQK